jgi:hypothetical protein
LPLLLVAFLVGSGLRFQFWPSPNATVVKATDLGSIPTNPDILGRAYSTFFHGYSVWQPMESWVSATASILRVRPR